MSKSDLLLTLLKESVNKCYQNDKILIERGMEQASVARIYYYMQKALEQDKRFDIFTSHQLDSEYNKRGENIKSTPRFVHGTRPDIILHYRLDAPCRDNVIIMEFKAKLKRGGNTIPQRDKNKLEDFTARQGEYNYFLGVFIRLNEQSAEYRYFQDGYEKSESELDNDQS